MTMMIMVKIEDVENIIPKIGDIKDVVKQMQ